VAQAGTACYCSLRETVIARLIAVLYNDEGEEDELDEQNKNYRVQGFAYRTALKASIKAVQLNIF
jgi:hypothetical protein